MEELLGAAALAGWLGILTSVSPCPLAANIAAVTFISGSLKEEKPFAAFVCGMLYTLGRMATYMVLAILMVKSLQSVPEVSFFLQNYMNKLLGPLLIIVGMFLLQLISLPSFGNFLSQDSRQRLAGHNYWGAFALGAIFAVSFCPVSAALFFGSLLPLAIKFDSGILLPSAYGLGTSLPVLGFALLIVFSVKSVNKAFEKIKTVEKWARSITGIVFIGVGVYYILQYVFIVL